MKENITVSAVIPTIGALSALPRLKKVVKGVQKQSFKVIELIIVWQGEENLEFVASLPSFVKIQHETIRGSARARNIGAASAIGDLVWFLDDDTLPESSHTLKKAIDAISIHNLDFVLANIICKGRNKASKAVDHNTPITKKSLRGKFSEPGLLIYKKLFDQYKFDESLGIGCLHGSSEGFDLGARLIKNGVKGIKLHDYILHHPELLDDYQTNTYRIFFYSLGNGTALLKNRYYGWYIYEFLRIGYWLLKGFFRLDKQLIKNTMVRCFCLLLGPLVPRRSPKPE